MHGWAAYMQRTAGVTESRPSLDDGTIVHDLLLSHVATGDVASQIDWLEFPDWRTNASKEARDNSRANGRHPVLAHKRATYEAMTTVAKTKLAEIIPRDSVVTTEVPIVFEDSGVLCRAKPDLIATARGGQDAMIVEIKTVSKIDHDSFAAHIWRYGYDIQAHVYRQAVVSIAAADSSFPFYWLVVEKEYPYCCFVTRPLGDVNLVGADRWKRARETWRRCLATDEWPGPAHPWSGMPSWAVDKFYAQELEELD